MLPGKLIAVNGEATVALDIGGEIKTRAPIHRLPPATASRSACARTSASRDDGEALPDRRDGPAARASIVHEVRTADGRAIKVTERAPPAHSRARPAAPCACRQSAANVISVFPAAAA